MCVCICVCVCVRGGQAKGSMSRAPKSLVDKELVETWAGLEKAFTGDDQLHRSIVAVQETEDGNAISNVERERWEGWVCPLFQILDLRKEVSIGIGDNSIGKQNIEIASAVIDGSSISIGINSPTVASSWVGATRRRRSNI